MTTPQSRSDLPSLLPCPHCGKQPTFYRCGGFDTFQAVIECCGFQDQDFEDAIVKAWNKRSPVSEQQPLSRGELDALIDFHDWNDAGAEAMDMPESAKYHAERSAYFKALRDALPKSNERNER